jgi:hypothetical protein
MKLFPEKTVVETVVEKEVQQQQPAGIVLTEEQKKMAQRSVQS